MTSRTSVAHLRRRVPRREEPLHREPGGRIARRLTDGSVVARAITEQPRSRAGDVSRELVEQYDGGEHAARRAPPRRVLEDFLAAAVAQHDATRSPAPAMRASMASPRRRSRTTFAVQFLQAAVEPLAQHGLDERVLVDAAAARE